MQGHGRTGHGAGSCSIIRFPSYPHCASRRETAPPQPPPQPPHSPHENFTGSLCWAPALDSCPLTPWADGQGHLSAGGLSPTLGSSAVS